MGRKGERVRLFVAVYPPLEVAARLLETLDALGLPPHRPTRPEQVHLTLQFIGEMPRREVRAATESVARSCAGLGAFTVKALTLATVPESPPNAPPRLVAMMTDRPATLLELHARLALRFARHRRPERPDRYSPHITLCRFPEGTRGGPWACGVENEGLVFEVREVRLMASHLRVAGAEHETVAAVPLDQ